MRSYVISDREAGQRVDKYLLRMLHRASPGFVYKMLRKKNIVVNGKKADGSYLLRAGDEVRLYLSEETIEKFAQGEQEPSRAGGEGIRIVYEDDDILIIDKPAGLLSQRAKPGDDSANDRVIAYLLQSGQMTREDLKTFHPSICNRLDRNTSGLLIAGKTMRGLQETAALLQSRDLKKYYHALVWGCIKQPQHLTGLLVKDGQTNRVRVLKEGTQDPSAGSAEQIETAYRPLEHCGNATLLEVELLTGRPHQIRAHLASIGHPILGDPKYGDAAVNRSLTDATGQRGQLLCACRMVFPDGRVIEIPDPDSFAAARDWLAHRDGTGK